METGPGRNDTQRQMGAWPHPGGPGCWTAPYSCSKLLACLRKHGVRPLPANGKCPPGTYKVAAYTKGPKDPSNYHFVRQDSNGKWSCKFGAGEVGPQFDNPDDAANSNPVSPGYNRCSVVCFPCKMSPRIP